MSWQPLVSGRFAEAEQVAVRAAESIQPHGEVPRQALSVYGSLLVQVANAAARDARSALAADFLKSASEVAQRVGTDRVDYEVPFGPSLVTMQTVDVGVVTEDYPAALIAASRMPANPGLPLASRCRHLADRACAHANLGQEEQALNRRVLHASCSCRGVANGFANLVVSKRDGCIELAPHVTGFCTMTSGRSRPTPGSNSTAAGGPGVARRRQSEQGRRVGGG